MIDIVLVVISGVCEMGLHLYSFVHFYLCVCARMCSGTCMRLYNGTGIDDDG